MKAAFLCSFLDSLPEFAREAVGGAKSLQQVLRIADCTTATFLQKLQSCSLSYGLRLRITTPTANRTAAQEYIDCIYTNLLASQRDLGRKSAAVPFFLHCDVYGWLRSSVFIVVFSTRIPCPSSNCTTADRTVSTNFRQLQLQTASRISPTAVSGSMP